MIIKIYSTTKKELALHNAYRIATKQKLIVHRTPLTTNPPSQTGRQYTPVLR